MRRNDHIVQAKQRIRGFPIAQFRWFLLNVIETGASNPAFFQCLVQGTVIDNRPTRGIDEDGTWLHTAKLGFIYEMTCL